MKLKHTLAALALATWCVAPVAGATTVFFQFNNGSETAATGSFSYVSGDTGVNGVLGYGDLIAFNIELFGVTYDLADVLGELHSYDHFAYDIADNEFLGGQLPGPYYSYLSAISGTSGFFFAEDGAFEEYQNRWGGAYDRIVLNNVDPVVGTGNPTPLLPGVPEPATWAMMLLGIGMIGAGMRMARRKDGMALTAA